jgi:hypothetical protein
MGAVYKAVHLHFDELRALKVISRKLMTDEASSGGSSTRRGSRASYSTQTRCPWTISMRPRTADLFSSWNPSRIRA